LESELCKMRIHILQHHGFETAGMILDWAAENKYSVSHTLFFQEKPILPILDQLDILIIMGGTMSVQDEQKFPWLTLEKTFIRQAIEARKIILGICLGSQLLAEALGARVYQNHQNEIGFFPVYKTIQAKNECLLSHIPNPWIVFHWHGDTLEMPEDAIHLLYSEACEHQAFRKGFCVGLQFHPEVDQKILYGMVEFEREALLQDVFTQNEIQILSGNKNESNRKYLYQFMDKLVALI
jgi:GMP synthase-like glutamine amidotransferase